MVLCLPFSFLYCGTSMSVHECLCVNVIESNINNKKENEILQSYQSYLRSFIWLHCIFLFNRFLTFKRNMLKSQAVQSIHTRPNSCILETLWSSFPEFRKMSGEGWWLVDSYRCFGHLHVCKVSLEQVFSDFLWGTYSLLSFTNSCDDKIHFPHWLV